jgi:hypothetical protein
LTPFPSAPSTAILRGGRDFHYTLFTFHQTDSCVYRVGQYYLGRWPMRNAHPLIRTITTIDHIACTLAYENTQIKIIINFIKNKRKEKKKREKAENHSRYQSSLDGDMYPKV